MEHVVVVDGAGTPVATIPKVEAHTRTTPLHLAFSCHVVRADGSVLLTRRAWSKPTWPGVWSNACCGHPQLGEPLLDAVRRRLGEELGLRPTRLAIAVPDFAYRAEMADGTVEHELCPVVVAEVAGEPGPDPAEVADVAWVAWDELRRVVADEPGSLSPWSVQQVRELLATGWSPDGWLTGAEPPARVASRPPATGEGVDVGEELDALLTSFLDGKAAELAALDPALLELTGAVRDLVVAGGKRLRPAFVYWGHRAAGAGHDPAVLHAAAAVELLHTFALLHDDVMDRSAMRRGMPAAHVALADRHRDVGRTGDAAWFGTSAAILAGDLAHVWADELLDGAPLAPEAVARGRRVFAALRAEVTAGQHLDLVLAGDPDATDAAARKVALLKSARYSVTRPLELGAALAPQPPSADLARWLQQFGDAVGLAFQLRDDVLGLFGDPDETGKGTLEDIREGKRTLLVLRAMRLADDRGRAVLRSSLGDPTVDEERADAVRRVVARSGALASVELLLRSQHDAALAASEAFPEPARTHLRALADSAIVRRS